MDLRVRPFFRTFFVLVLPNFQTRPSKNFTSDLSHKSSVVVELNTIGIALHAMLYNQCQNCVQAQLPTEAVEFEFGACCSGI